MNLSKNDLLDIKMTLIDLAKNCHLGYPFSACLIYNEKEYYAVNAVTAFHDPTAHAEINVIRDVCHLHNVHNLEGAILISSGEPCPMCLSAIAWAGIKEVYFIDDYYIAQSQGYEYDQNSLLVNKKLNLGLKIRKIE